MTNKEIIKQHTIFHAYFCYLIDTNQADFVEELCQISLKLNEEIKRRKISQLEIKECIKSISLDPQDSLMINKYIFPELINSEAAIS